MESTVDTAKLIETSFLIIREKQDSFAPLFYKKLFTLSPQLKPMFRHVDMKQQAKKLYGSLVLLVENIRDTAFLTSVLTDLGQKHVGYGVIASHYPVVGQALIAALKETAGAEWNNQVEQAWLDTYQVVVQLMLGEQQNNEREDSKQLEAHLEELQEQQLPRFRPTKKLTYAQKRKRRQNKSLVTKIIDWFWAKPGWQIASYAAVLFLIVSYLGQENRLIERFIDTLEPLSIFIAVLLYIKELPERKKQFQYQAWSVIDRAVGIENSPARQLALEELCDAGVSLAEIDLNRANLNKIELNGVDLSYAQLQSAQLAQAELFYTDFSHAQLQKALCTEMICYRSDFRFAQFQEANCSGANFSRANLMFADFTQANLSGCNFSYSNLKGANFEGAYINGANFTGAHLIEEDLQKAQLSEVVMPDGQLVR